MKRRRVSPFRMGLSIFLLVFFLAGIVVFSWLLTMYHPADAAHPYDWGFVGAMSPIVACTIGLVLALYMAVQGRVLGYVYRGCGGYDHLFSQAYISLLWQDCLEFEIVPVMVNHGTAAWSFIAPQRRFPKSNGTISSNITKTIMRISSFSSFAMRRLIRSSLAAFRSGHATISRRKCRCMA